MRTHVCEEKTPVYQYRYQRGALGYTTPWQDIAETCVTTPYGVNRITSIEIRIKPEREVCEAAVNARPRGTWAGSRDHRCVRDLGHAAREGHLTYIDDLVVYWFDEHPGTSSTFSETSCATACA